MAFRLGLSAGLIQEPATKIVPVSDLHMGAQYDEAVGRPVPTPHFEADEAAGPFSTRWPAREVGGS